MQSWMMPSFSSNGYCVMLWFAGCALDTKAKYVAGVVIVFFLAILTALLPVLQTVLVHRGTIKDRVTTSVATKATRTVLYAVQMFFAYLCMLVVMMYETILFCAVIFGLSVGHFASLVATEKLQQRWREQKEGDTKPVSSSSRAVNNDAALIEDAPCDVPDRLLPRNTPCCSC